MHRVHIRGSAVFPIAIFLLSSGMAHAVSQWDIVAPPGSGQFGYSVAILKNGNLLVGDPGFDAPGPITDVGAAHLYDRNGVLLSTLTGTTANDRVGQGVRAFGAHALVFSPAWDDGNVENAGAVTWIDGTAGLSGQVSIDNSLVGTTSEDGIEELHTSHDSHGVSREDDGMLGNPSAVDDPLLLVARGWDDGSTPNVGALVVLYSEAFVTGRISADNALVGSTPGDLRSAYPIRLANGNYVVSFADWRDDDGRSGAVVWFDADHPLTGPISAGNALVNTRAAERSGKEVIALRNGNYVVLAPAWDHGAITDAGAVVWADGDTGIVGPITAENALIGRRPGDRVGEQAVELVDNGNFVVASPEWDSDTHADVGAATWVDGSTGLIGTVSEGNSLVGVHEQNGIGMTITPLANGNYVVDSGSLLATGNATWGSGLAGIAGPVSESNSLFGARMVTALTNGHYVFSDSAALEGRGLVMWANGDSASAGVASPSNALVGAAVGDHVGFDIVALSDGDYVVVSPRWNVDTGAVTRLDGTTASTGVLDAAQSLTGSNPFDRVGDCAERPCVRALADGQYVVLSPNWRNGLVFDAGAVTWSGIATTGEVSAANSLVGVRHDDQVGGSIPHARTDQPFPAYFLVQSGEWDNGSIVDAGAVTRFDAATGGPVGPVSESNSLVGSSPGDYVGGGEGNTYPTAWAINDTRYLIVSGVWRNGNIVRAGAITFGRTDVPLTGPVEAVYSVLGTVANQGPQTAYLFDARHDRGVVTRPPFARVTVFDFALFRDGFE